MDPEGTMLLANEPWEAGGAVDSKGGRRSRATSSLPGANAFLPIKRRDDDDASLSGMDTFPTKPKPLLTIEYPTKPRPPLTIECPTNEESATPFAPATDLPEEEEDGEEEEEEEIDRSSWFDVDDYEAEEGTFEGGGRIEDGVAVVDGSEEDRSSEEDTVLRDNSSFRERRRRRRRRKKKMCAFLLCLLFVFAVVMGLAFGLTSRNGDGRGGGDAPSDSKKELTAEDCWEELRQEEEEAAVVSNAMPAVQLARSGESGEVSEETGEEAAASGGGLEEETSSREGSERRDLRGGVARRKARRRLECEELLGASEGGEPGDEADEEPVEAVEGPGDEASGEPAPETGEPTNEPTVGPTNGPTSSPTQYYKYANSTTVCDAPDVVAPAANVRGPAPFDDGSNVAVRFFAFGNAPYDPYSNTCVGEDGTREEECSRWDCTASTRVLPPNNTCTYEGPEYECVRETLIPYMNGRIEDGDAAFVVHTGDFIRGSGPAKSTRCTDSSFSSRKELFAESTNFLAVPGDNEWNECHGYDIFSNADPAREMWRDHFATDLSPFNQFGRNFPNNKTRPAISRQVGNPENYFFVHENVAFFGLNRVDGRSYLKNKAPVDLNEAWVADRLRAEEGACALRSVVIVSHSPPGESVYRRAEEHSAACGRVGTLPVLAVTGNGQPPRTYCMTRDESRERVNVRVEAFESGPLLVSVVRDPDGGGGDYFHVEDADPADTNRRCPTFS